MMSSTLIARSNDRIVTAFESFSMNDFPRRRGAGEFIALSVTPRAETQKKMHVL
jgi:hypothetical protein